MNRAKQLKAKNRRLTNDNNDKASRINQLNAEITRLKYNSSIVSSN